MHPRPAPWFLTILVAIGLQAMPAAAALAPPPQRCMAAKLQAASQAYQCALKESARMATRGEGDLAECAEKLTERFAAAELKGGCPTAGDSALAVARAESAAADAILLLGGAAASTDDEKRCLEKKAKFAAVYTRCQSKALGTRILGTYRGLRDDFSECRADHTARSSELELAYSCASVGEAGDVQQASGAGYGFLPGVEWTSADLDGAPLAGARLVGARLTSVRLTGADLRGADLTDAQFENVTIVSTDLRDADLSGASVRNVDFGGSAFGGATLGTATLESILSSSVPSCPVDLPAEWTCLGGFLLGPTALLDYDDLNGLDLTGLNLSNARFFRANLRDAILANANLSNANLQVADLRGANLAGANLSNAVISETYGSTLVSCPASLPASYDCIMNNLVGPGMWVADCDLAGADLGGMNLSSMRFIACDLRGTVFSGSGMYGTLIGHLDATGADFSSVTLRDATIIQANLTGADFGGAHIEDVAWIIDICPDGIESTSVPGTCCGHHVGAAPAYCE